LLENAAAEALDAGLPPWDMGFEISTAVNQDHGFDAIISAKPVFAGLQEGLQKGVCQSRLALGFHYAVADMILKVCGKIREAEHIEAVALSGGVFQNKILMERALALLRAEGFTPYYNISVSPNDGGICLGQNYLGMMTFAKNAASVDGKQSE